MVKYYDEIENSKCLYFISDSDKEYTYALPNVFFITGTGILYRVFSNKGVSTLKKCFDIIDDVIYDRKIVDIDGNSKYLDIDTLLDREIKKYYEIVNNNTVSSNDVKEYLGFDYNILPKSIPVAMENILGNISARIEVYKFFRDLINYTTNPKEEYEKILVMCANDYCDILVKCCGFNKVETMNYHEITTCNLDYENDLFNYMIKDWHIVFFPPIVINKAKGIVEDKKDNIYVKRLMYGL